MVSKLLLSLEKFALEHGFNNFHELRKVANKSPNDVRLMVAAFGVRDFAEVADKMELSYEMDGFLEDELTSEMASTNASMFTAENLEVIDACYDEETGRLTLEGSVEFNGEQDKERLYYGAGFVMDFEALLLYRQDRWEFDDENALSVSNIISDADLDDMPELYE